MSQDVVTTPQRQPPPPSPPQHLPLPYLIDVFTDDIAVGVGTSPRSLGRLGLEHYRVPFSILLIGSPDCPFCARMALTLNDAVKGLKNNTTGVAPFLVYSLILTKTDPRAVDTETGLQINMFPTMFIVDGKGNLTPLISNYMKPDAIDVMGNGRLQTPEDVHALMRHIQQNAGVRPMTLFDKQQ